MKRIAIVQSCYLPWRGFFDLISRCDEYVVYDQVAYSKGHWHNRNRIKTPAGLRWLTIPVLTSQKLGQRIEDVEVKPGWAEAHFEQIAQSYRRADQAAAYLPWIEKLLQSVAETRFLTDINETLLRRIAEELQIATVFTRDRDYSLTGKRSERVLATCLAAGATHYLSGPSARSYLDETMFRNAGVTVEWMNYGPYAPYPQVHGDFEAQVSMIDMLLNVGREASVQTLAPSHSR